MTQNPQLQYAFTFPYRWLTDPEDKKHLSANFIQSLRRAGVKEVYSTSSTDKYAAQFGGIVTAYFVRLKTHAYQPVKIPLSKAQVATALKPAFPHAQCLGLETFFVQTDSNGLPVMELEIYY